MNDRRPPAFLLRAAQLDDLSTVTELVVACDKAAYGGSDFNSEELLVDWRRNGFNLATDAWVVCTSEGKVIGYGDVHSDGTLVRLNPNTCVHPDYRGQGIGTNLLERAEQWVGERTAEGTLRYPVILDQFVGHSNAASLELMRSQGYRPVRYHWRMEIDMDAEPPAPEYPDGIQARPFVPGADDRAVHAAIQEAFEDIWAHEPHSFDDWELFVPKRVGFDAKASFLAFDREEVVGAIMSFDYSPMGWVRQIGVRRKWRGRGLALALLRQVFVEFFRRGIRKVGLVVDAESLTGATRLYQRAGMRVAHQFDQFQKHLEIA